MVTGCVHREAPGPSSSLTIFMVGGWNLPVRHQHM
jgi:hypothetical protein